MLKVKELTMIYDRRGISGLHKLNFDIKTGEHVALMGESGSGKSTLLNVLKNDIKDYQGHIQLEANKVLYLAAGDSLDNEKTVLENLVSCLQEEDLAEDQKINATRSLLSSLELTNEINQKAGSLSAGQYQRILLASLLIQKPDLLLLDEPFSHLDPKLKKELLKEIFELTKKDKTSVVYVTHSKDEAFEYADKIMLLQFGYLKAFAPHEELYQNPPNAYTAEYLFETNLVNAKVQSTDQDQINLQILGNKVLVTKESKHYLKLENLLSKDESYALFLIPPNILAQEMKDEASFSLLLKKFDQKLQGNLLKLNLTYEDTELFFYTPRNYQDTKNLFLHIEHCSLISNHF